MLAIAAIVAALATPVPGVALVHHPVSTKSVAAQQKFDEGLTLVYSFNRMEARKRFEDAARLDPKLAMAWWGVALGAGPNINESMNADDLAAAHDAIAKAQGLEANASPEEREYIAAIAVRYPPDVAGGKFAPYTAYRAAMKALAADFPDDLDAATLYAESIMDVEGAPFDHGVQSADDAAVVAILNGVLARDAHHIGANHYLIHAWDHQGTGDRALAAANYLAGLNYEPADSHLQHMPGHTYLDVGDLGSLENVGRLSTLDDDAYAKSLGVDPFSLRYYRHDLDFWVGGALLIGERGEIDQATAEFRPDHAVEAALIYAREGDYADVDALPLAKAKNYTRVTLRYARVLSALGRSDVPAATREVAALDALLRSYGSTPVEVREGALAHARLAHALGDDETAISLLRKFLAGAADDPPEESRPWFFPAGEWLGDILLEKGDLEGAETAFRTDLARTPNNARVLYGLMRTLTREGRLDDARALAAQIAANWRGDPMELRGPDL